MYNPARIIITPAILLTNFLYFNNLSPIKVLDIARRKDNRREIRNTPERYDRPTTRVLK